MRSARIKHLAMIGLSPFVVMGCARTASIGGRGGLQSSSGASNSNTDSLVCTSADTALSFGPTVITDLSDGVSSDGRGPYVRGTDGTANSFVGNAAQLTLYHGKESAENQRQLTVNLNDPIPGGGGVALGIITDGSGNGLHTQWYRVGRAVQSLQNIRVGQTVMAAQMNVTFHINGRKHLLQMGPQPNGHCHNGGTTLVNGTGTSSGTIYRASPTKWVMNLPAGSVGRLFDVENTPEYAVDKGLYRVRLHYEIGN